MVSGIYQTDLEILLKEALLVEYTIYFVITYPNENYYITQNLKFHLCSLAYNQRKLISYYSERAEPFVKPGIVCLQTD